MAGKLKKQPAKPPKGADTSPVRKSGGFKPRGNPKLKMGRPGTGRVIPS